MGELTMLPYTVAAFREGREGKKGERKQMDKKGMYRRID